MRVVKQYHEILSFPDNLLQALETAGRTCYKSEDQITPDSAVKFVKRLIERGHHAMIEFGDIIIKFVTNRGVTHELVRHRLCSFAQESTRYVNYLSREIEFIQPVWINGGFLVGDSLIPMKIWLEAMRKAEWSYKDLLIHGWQPQQAREVLPNSLKTEIVVKANIREWRHIFKLRCSKGAHPQMRALMLPCLQELKEKLPVVFDDVEADAGAEAAKPKQKPKE
jgi:thymidylate synthase (FAD)